MDTLLKVLCKGLAYSSETMQDPLDKEMVLVCAAFQNYHFEKGRLLIIVPLHLSMCIRNMY